MDLVMPEVDGAEATRRIKEACPEVQVIALTSYKEDDLVQGALKAGALSYLLKNVTRRRASPAPSGRPMRAVPPSRPRPRRC